MTASTLLEDSDRNAPGEPSPDAYEWTEEPDAPNEGGAPAEFVNEPGEEVPGVRREPGRPQPVPGSTA